MSTSAKTCPPKNVKKAKYKMAFPISKERAEAFVGPQAEVRPRFSEVPSERDAKAFRLAAQGMTQRQIAEELGCSQPTVQRAIGKYRRWFGTTLPEDRGEMTGFARFRVAVEERRIFLRHQQELAMEEWHQSRQSVPMVRERTKVYPEGRKAGGPEVKEVITDKYLQKRHASAAHLNAAGRLSLELTMLEAGYLGVRQLSCDKAMDTDERDRWDRAVKSRDKTIEELTRKVAELEAKLAAGVALADEPTANSAKPTSGPSARQPVEHRRVMSGAPAPSESALAVKGGATSCGNMTPTSPLTASGAPLVDESGTAQTTPVLNQTSPGSTVASPVQQIPSGERPGSSPFVSQTLNPVNHVGVPALAGRVALADEPTANSAKPINVPSARQPVEHRRDLSGAEAHSESALAVKGRATSCGDKTPTRPLTASGTPPDEPSRSSCPSDAEVALRLLQIRRLKTRH